ncbi:MAG: tRNA (cytidine(34)-2'-O)-methyltransferase [Verrucomicrobiales bacterium]
MEPPLHIVLYQPEIPPNTGNIGRLCSAAGIRLHLIEPLGFSLDEKQVRRAGMDYWAEVDLRRWASLEDLIASAPGARLFYFSTKASRVIWDEAFQAGDYLVFGPETRGLPESILAENAARCLRLPMQSGRSLNLSSAAAIAAYEAARQIGWLNG